MIIENL